MILICLIVDFRKHINDIFMILFVVSIQNMSRVKG